MHFWLSCMHQSCPWVYFHRPCPAQPTDNCSMHITVLQHLSNYSVSVMPHSDLSVLENVQSKEFLKEFGTKGDLSGRLHLPTDRNSYVCSVCGKCLETAQCLRVHGSKFRCSECGKCFTNNEQLTVHRRIHLKEKLFECGLP